MKLFNMSLSRMGKLFCTTHFKMDLPSDIHTQINGDNYLDMIDKHNLDVYCLTDSKVLYESMLNVYKKINDKYKISIFENLSMSAVSFTIYRKMFMDTLIFKPDLHCNLASVFSYFGGRNEVFIPYLGDQKVYKYDINSSYPASMLLKLPKSSGVLTLYELPFGNKLSIGLYEIIAPSNLKIPFLPLKLEHSIIYPLGTWFGWYTSVEINYARKLGYKCKFISGYYFESGNICKSFVENLYQLKLDNNYKDVAKLILNSLYGRFALKQKLFNTEVRIFENESEFNPVYSNLLLKYESVNFNHFDYPNKIVYEISYTKALKPQPINVFKPKKDESLETIENQIITTLKDMHRHVTISAFITAYSRINLYEAMQSVGLNNVLYTDTDSIIVSKELSDNFICSTTLGKWKDEFPGGSTKAIFLNKKFYVYEDQSKIAGYSGNLTFNNFLKIYDKIKEQRRILLSKNKISKILSHFDTVEYRNLDHTLTWDYTHRVPIFYNNKWIDTKPLIVNYSLQESLTLLRKYHKDQLYYLPSLKENKKIIDLGISLNPN